MHHRIPRVRSSARGGQLRGAARIDGGGGQVSVNDVTNDLVARYPDITESSIRTYLGTLELVLKGGVVRRRTKADGWPLARR